MKIFSKMSARDRSLLILLLTVVVFYLCYTFVISPSMEQAEILKTNLTAVKSEIAKAEELSGKEDQLRTEERTLRKDLIKKYSDFFFDLNQSRLLNKVDALMAGAGLPPTSYMPSPEAASQVQVEIGSYKPVQYPLKDLAAKINPESQENGKDENQGGNQAGNNEAPPANAGETADMIPFTDVSIGFSGASYESIFNFIASVENMNKTVVLKSVDISEDEGGLSGTLVFSFYSLPKLDSAQKDGLDYSPVIPAGKANPFI